MSPSVFTRGTNPAHADYCRVRLVNDFVDQWARLVKLSTTKVSLLIAVPFERGTLVQIVWPRSVRVLKARVVHANEEWPGCHLIEADIVEQFIGEDLDLLMEKSWVG